MAYCTRRDHRVFNLKRYTTIDLAAYCELLVAKWLEHTILNRNNLGYNLLAAVSIAISSNQLCSSSDGCIDKYLASETQ